MIDKIVSYLKGKVDSFEVFYEDLDLLSVNLQKGEPDLVSQGFTQGVSVRVEIKKRLGLASTLNLERYKECCDTAIKFAKINNPDKNFIKFQEKQSYPKVNSCEKQLVDFSFEEIKQYLKEVNDTFNEKKIKTSVTNYTKAVSTTRIVNSEGVDGERKTGVNSRYYELLKGKSSLSCTDESLFPLQSEKAREEVERLQIMENPASVKTSEMQLLLAPEALADLFAEALFFSFDAENVHLKKSFLTGKIGKQVFDKSLHIEDNALVPGYLHSRSFDDEGTASQRTELVKNGVVKNFLFDTYYGFLEKKASTANAVRSLASSPSISPSNILLSSGAKSKEQLFSMIDKGVLVRGMMGLHTMDAATGDFSLNVSEGHFIQKGERKHALKETMIAGNFFDILKSVEALGKKVEHAGHGQYLPYVLLPKVKVIGA